MVWGWLVHNWGSMVDWCRCVHNWGSMVHNWSMDWSMVFHGVGNSMRNSMVGSGNSQKSRDSDKGLKGNNQFYRSF